MDTQLEANSTQQPLSRRWIDQLWTLDNVIAANGIDWDQPRSFYLNAPCGIEASADFAGIRQNVRKFADIGPAFQAVADRPRAGQRIVDLVRISDRRSDGGEYDGICW